MSQRQVALVRAALDSAITDLAIESIEITTTGDLRLDTPLPEIGGKGVFTLEIEQALLAGDIDFAVHSLKDLPTANPAGIVIGAILPRADLADVLITRTGADLAGLPAGAVIGTSSHRRAAQVRRLRPDLQTQSIRGNVETRLRKGLDPAGPYDGIILARAGLERLDLLTSDIHVLSLADMLPAPGQAALAIQCRDDDQSRDLAARINHLPTELAVLAERAFLHGLGGGCSAPVACAATWSGANLQIHGRVLALDGSEAIDVTTAITQPDRSTALNAGQSLADEALSQGADRLLLEART